MTPSLASLKTKFTALLVAIADKLDTKLDKAKAEVLAANVYVTIPADSTHQIDLQTVLGAGYVNYDLKTAEICVRVEDTNAASPLFGAYANAEAFVSYGLLSERYVVVANQSAAAVDAYVKVTVHPIVI